ncbi:hypothetical protein [Curtobacterium flaccumfaciens]|uniref:acyl-CoA-like ligand-binding transcription factor n=1 Tax=Curtobacterium flaccumfaciens TaxID=2035 RepID=UPI0027DF9BAE|nr:hypothetical protein [Curtobacterium flaccumfaciens]
MATAWRCPIRSSRNLPDQLDFYSYLSESFRRRTSDEILRYVAERDGVTADDLAVAVRAHTLAAAASAALTWWALHGDGRPEDVLERALALLD